MKKYIAIFCFLLISQSVVADGKTGIGVIEEIYPVSTGEFFVRISWQGNAPGNSVPNLSGCSQKDWFHNGGLEPGADRLYSALLSAFVAEKKVELHFKDGTNCNQ